MAALFRLTPRLHGGGVGRRLCMPTYHGLSDGPWRDMKFRLSPVRHDFQNVLVSGDCRKLVSTAEELLTLDPQPAPKSRAFWEIFSKRVKSSIHLLAPLDMALIAESFYRHGKDTGVFAALAVELKNKVREMDALSLRTMAEIISQRLRKGSQAVLLEALLWRLPNVSFQLSSVDTSRFLLDVARGGVRDEKACQLMIPKLLRGVPLMAPKDLGTMARALAAHNCRNSEIFVAILRRVVALRTEIDQKAFIRLCRGFTESGQLRQSLLQQLFSAFQDRFRDADISLYSKSDESLFAMSSKRQGVQEKKAFGPFSDFELSVVCQAVEILLEGYDSDASESSKSCATSPDFEKEPSSNAVEDPIALLPGSVVSSLPDEAGDKRAFFSFLQSLHRKLVSVQRSSHLLG